MARRGSPHVDGTQAGADPLCLSAGAWFGITFATFWIALLAHEGAHLGVAHFVYSPTELATGCVRPIDRLLVVGAGPAFTLAMIVACAAVTRRWGKAAAVGIAAIACGVSRILIISPATLLNRAERRTHDCTAHWCVGSRTRQNPNQAEPEPGRTKPNLAEPSRTLLMRLALPLGLSRRVDD
jgi:hypothetical protein